MIAKVDVFVSRVSRPIIRRCDGALVISPYNNLSYDNSPFDNEFIQESHMFCLDAEHREVSSASQEDKATMDCFLHTLALHGAWLSHMSFDLKAHTMLDDGACWRLLCTRR